MRRPPPIPLLLALLALAACGGGGGGNDAPPVELGVFPSASVVIAQPDFFSSEANQGAADPTAHTMEWPNRSPTAGTLYLIDTSNNRVLGFLAAPAFNDADADFVLGQNDFVSRSAGTSATELSAPRGLSSDGTRLAVADHNNFRVLLWSSLPTSNVPASAVVGQPDFSSKAAGTTAAMLGAPVDVQLAGGRLFVVNRSANRVLIWNTIPTTNGVAADVVLGQPDFTSGDAGTTASAFDGPSGIWSDGVRVAVADAGNHRVLIWSAVPAANGTPADVVLGQPDFTSNAPGAGATGLRFPYDLSSNGSQLLIADTGNNRVLIHDVFPTTVNRPADQVIGQSDFEHRASNDDDQDGSSDGNPTERTLDSPTGVLATEDRLFVVDTGNSRILVFDR